MKQKRLKVCGTCEYFEKKLKCKFICCYNMYKMMLSSKLAKCPKNKW